MPNVALEIMKGTIPQTPKQPHLLKTIANRISKEHCYVEYHNNIKAVQEEQHNLPSTSKIKLFPNPNKTSMKITPGSYLSTSGDLIKFFKSKDDGSQDKKS